jgi:hypothetical protein
MNINPVHRQYMEWDFSVESMGGRGRVEPAPGTSF